MGWGGKREISLEHSVLPRKGQFEYDQRASGVNAQGLLGVGRNGYRKEKGGKHRIQDGECWRKPFLWSFLELAFVVFLVFIFWGVQVVALKRILRLLGRCEEPEFSSLMLRVWLHLGNLPPCFRNLMGISVSSLITGLLQHLSPSPHGVAPWNCTCD